MAALPSGAEKEAGLLKTHAKQTAKNTALILLAIFIINGSSS